MSNTNHRHIQYTRHISTWYKHTLEISYVYMLENNCFCESTTRAITQQQSLYLAICKLHNTKKQHCTEIQQDEAFSTHSSTYCKKIIPDSQFMDIVIKFILRYMYAIKLRIEALGFYQYKMT